MTTTDSTAPSLVLVCGLPGVGKSTVAAYLTDTLSGVRLRTDVVRKDCFETPTYTDSETDTVYETVFERAHAHLDSATPVVLDATFKRRRYRQAARQVAVALGSPFVILKVEADPETTKQRIRSREGISDASIDVYREHREQFEPLELGHHVIDNSGSLEQTYSQVDAVVNTTELTVPTSSHE